MTLTRIQGSDFQDAVDKEGHRSIDGNLSKLEAIVDAANANKSVGLDLVGDLYDTHITELVLHQSGTPTTDKLLEEQPEIKKTIEHYNRLITELSKKYGNSLMKKIETKGLDSNEMSELEAVSKQMDNHDLAKAQYDDTINAIAKYYGVVESILSKCETKKYIVRGNNDTPFMQKIVKSGTYLDIEGRLIEDGAFRICGLNNTNYDPELAFGKDPNLTIPNDAKDALSKYSLAKTEKKANIIMLHGPPNGFRDGHDTPEADPVTKLIEEHKNKDSAKDGYLLVECGHFHKALLEEKDGVIYARSSPNVFFKHEFDDNGKYQSTVICKYMN